MSEPTALCKILGVSFRDTSLLLQALTHASAVANHPNQLSYDRLEFLGDRVLGVIISDILLRTFPHAPEGELSRRLAALVRRETCTHIARELDLGTYIRVGKNMRPNQGKNNDNVLADVMEAILGAIYIDQGFETVHKVVTPLWTPHIHAPLQALKDPKSALQEWAQKLGYAAPVYDIIAQTGPDHKPHFTVQVVVETRAPCMGEGASRRHAEYQAAIAMLAACGE